MSRSPGKCRHEVGRKNKVTLLLLRSTLIYAPAVLLTRVSALIFMVVATRLVDKTEYGLLTLVVTVGEMTDVVVTNWLRIAFVRLGGTGEVSRGSVVRTGQILTATTILGVLIGAIATLFVVPERWFDFSVAVGAYLVAGAVSRYAITLLQMQQRHTTYSMMEFLRAVLQLVLPCATMVVEHNSFLAISLASSLGTLVAGIVASTFAARQIVAGPPRFTHREFFALGIPIVSMALLAFGLNNAERVFLKIYHDATAVAVFAAAYALARQPIDMVANAINIGAFPEAASRFDEEGPEAAARLFRQFIALVFSFSLPIAALLVALSDNLAAFLLPANYAGPYTAMFGIITLSAICMNLQDFVYGGMIFIHKRPWLLLIIKAFGTATTIGLAFIVIPPLGEIGAAIVLAGGAVVALIVSAIISNRLTPIQLPWREMMAAIVVSACVGGAARLAVDMAETLPVFFRLAAGGIAGGIVFAALNSLFYPQARKKAFNLVRARMPQIG